MEPVDANGFITGYSVTVADNSSNIVSMSSLGPEVMSHTVSDLMAGFQYTITVIASNSVGEGVASVITRTLGMYKFLNMYVRTPNKFNFYP